MKLIDQKGKIFGRFNILDTAIFIIVIVTAISIYMAVAHRDKLKRMIKGEYENWYLTAQIILSKEDTWLKNYIKPQDFEKDSYGRIMWQIKDVQEICDPNKDIRLLIKARLLSYKERSGALYYGRYSMIIGNFVSLDGSKYLIKGQFYSIGKPEEKVPF